MAEFIEFKPEIAPNLTNADADPIVGKQSRVRGLITLFNSNSRCGAKRRKTIEKRKAIGKKKTIEKQRTIEKQKSIESQKIIEKQNIIEEQNPEIVKEDVIHQHNSRPRSIRRLFGLGRSNAFELSDTEVQRSKVIKQATLDGLVQVKIRDSTVGTPSEHILENTEFEPFTLDGNKELSSQDDAIVSVVSDDVMKPADEDPNNSQHEIIQHLSQKIDKLTEANRKLSRENQSLSTELESTKNKLALVQSTDSQTIDETEEDRDTVTSLRRISQSFDDITVITRTLHNPDESTQTQTRKLQKAHSEL